MKTYLIIHFVCAFIAHGQLCYMHHKAKEPLGRGTIINTAILAPITVWILLSMGVNHRAIGWRLKPPDLTK